MEVRVPTDVSLTEGEVPLWFGQMSWAANWVWLLLAVFFLLTIFGIILSIIFVVIAYINVKTSEYFVSNKRIFVKYGLISRVMNDIKSEWVTNTSVAQDFFGRILNYGDVLIATPGSYTGTSMINGVGDPMRVKGFIDDRITKNKKIKEIEVSLRRMTDEYRMGRLELSRYNSLKEDYENEIKKYL